MPRKQFLADLNEAQLLSLPEGFESLTSGDDDGQFELSWKQTDLEIHITVVISDVSDYPSSHEYMIFCGDDTSPDLAKKINNIQRTDRKPILQLIDLLATELSNVPVQYDSDLEILDEDPDASESDMDEDEDDDIFLTGVPSQQKELALPQLGKLTQLSVKSAIATSSFKTRLRSDLKAVKDAGYRVGVLGDLSNGTNGFLSIAIRISKLGISDEAMLAWQTQPSDYLLLLISYSTSYCTMDQLLGGHNLSTSSPCPMRLFVSKSYKPTREEAITAFQRVRDEKDFSVPVDDKEMEDNMPSLRMTFLSRPFVRLLNEDLLPILRIRELGMDWAGAEAWYRDRENTNINATIVPDHYFEPETTKLRFPAMVTQDHYSEQKTRSFPVVAMQFALRHFVRCTEFCVVCHRKVSTEIEAIKPFVCERPLCLFQYMAMGFGPSIEHEIISQPYVVDLLISFCYAAAHMRKLKDLPIGLNIKVPSTKSLVQPRPLTGFQAHIATVTAVEDTGPNAEEFDIGFDRARQEIQFLDRRSGGCPVAKGSWVVIRITASASVGQEVLHCRVSETNFFPIIRVDKPIHVATGLARDGLLGKVPTQANHDAGALTPASKPDYKPCTLRRHDLDFDTLKADHKCDAICQLLDMLPSVKDMQSYLRRSAAKDLKRWIERIPASALQLLQWIIASNRACLMQVDDHPPNESTGLPSSTERRKDRLYGMPRYMQFRFAMGAPDKEERFLSAVRTTTRRLKLQYPTMFAWHGSPLHNWHMIIREGLHYKNVDHGRAYGDGVYHAQDAHTSMGYSRGGGDLWSNSALKVTNAIALNEIVNAPDEFKSKSPYYVVPQLDWIQTRYLLVQCETESRQTNTTTDVEVEPLHPHPQDPSRTPRGIKVPIIIPASAIKTGHRSSKHGTASPHKRLKTNSGDVIVIDSDSDFTSIASDDEDLAALSSGLVNGDKSQSVTEGCAKIALDGEDFVAGQLDASTLPLMPVPTFAVSATTQCLMKELQRLQKAMEATPQRELGWHMDTSSLENVYQWIVELHSFHTFEVKGKRLPMADDMKRQKIKSVVLEIRFGSDFPFSPPYIRVVRPRFLPFTQGGGGHIVMGGAMCMELLTNSGWIGSSSMESVLMQVRMAMASEPFARLDPHAKGDYGVAEAAEGYIRACNSHGWTVPPGFRDIAYGMPPRAELLR